MFKNGAEAGVFDIDKLGDAVNEFSIRVKDGTADNAFKELGMDVDATKKAFGEGGEAAKKAMQDTFEALGKVSDPLEQNTIGVELFGTMWEDTGGQAILAMGNMEGAASDAAGTMEKIKEMRYDDLASEFQGLGRSIQTELIKPLGEELGPVAKETIDTVKDNLPQAKEILKEVLTDITEFINFFVSHANVLLPLIAGIGAALLTWNVVTMIQGMVAAIKAWTVATEGATLAQKILNSTILANPAAWIITAIVGVVTALVLLWNNCEAFREAVKGILSAIVQFFKDAWNKIQEAWAAAQPYFEMIKEGIKTAFSVVAEILTAPFRIAWFLITSIWDIATTYFQNVWIGIQTVFSVVGQIIGGFSNPHGSL